MEVEEDSGHAQGSEWETLNDEAMSLYHKGQRSWRKIYLVPHPQPPLNLEAESLYIKEHYDRAVLVAKKALDVAEKEVVQSHSHLAMSMNNLALIYMAQEQYAEAEPLFKGSLDIWEKVHGPDDPEVAYTLNNLGVTYVAQGRYVEAEPLFKRSLAIYEKAINPDNPDTEPWFEKFGGGDVEDTLNNLADIYWNQGQYADVESVYKRKLAIWEKIVGPDDPALTDPLNDLANFYRTRGQYSQAESLYKLLLAIWEKAHSRLDVADTLNNLGLIYVAQEQYAKAEPLFKRSLAILEKARGSDHPTVATSLGNMAGLYRKTGRVKEAESLEKRAACIREVTDTHNCGAACRPPRK